MARIIIEDKIDSYCMSTAMVRVLALQKADLKFRDCLGLF
jgi:hypothetical protein